ncbi:dihydroxy-acid dehydratase, partial [Aureobasidium melanogenum]
MLSSRIGAKAARSSWTSRAQLRVAPSVAQTLSSRQYATGPGEDKIFQHIKLDKDALNKTSAIITQPKAHGASQAMLYATGFTDEDMNKAQVGISSVWYSGNPCNMHLMDLSNKVNEGVQRAGLKGMQFNTIGVSDGMSNGTTGMRYSLQSRDIIADSVETVMGGQWYDANISLPGCDKNMPGVIMAMGRVNRPSIMVYGGTIAAGCGKMSNERL